jgi:hypothetical protein
MSNLASKHSTRLSLEQIKQLPTPISLGPLHAPVPHHILVEGIEVEALERGYSISKMELAVSKDLSKLFGVIDLMPPGVVNVTDRGTSIGFRNSTNSTLAIKMVAGTRVFVCDNLALSGDMIAVLRRNTVGLDLEDELREGFDKFVKHASALDLEVARLQATAIADLAAKARIFDVFNSRILPVHLFDDVSEFYFKPAAEMTDCQPRTEWGLHNAFTRAMKKLPTAAGFTANVALGKAFGLASA